MKGSLLPLRSAAAIPFARKRVTWSKNNKEEKNSKGYFDMIDRSLNATNSVLSTLGFLLLMAGLLLLIVGSVGEKEG